MNVYSLANLETLPDISVFLNLNELALRGGERYCYAYELEMAPLLRGGQEYEVFVPQGTQITVDRIYGGFLVEVFLVASLHGPCERCLQEAEFEFEAREQEFVPTTAKDWDEADLSPYIKDFVVDVGSLAQEAMVLALPNQVVCSTQCKGLCYLCGKNLNLGSCECPSNTGDERWTILKDLNL